MGDGTIIRRNIPVEVSTLTGAIAVAAGYNYTLALKSDGTVWSWGLNTYGQLGNGTITQQTIPVMVSNLTGVIAIFAGASHSMALKSDGTLWSW